MSPMVRLEHANLSVTDVAAMTGFLTTAFPAFAVRGEGLDDDGRPWRHVGVDDFYVALQEVPTAGVRVPYGNSGGLNHLGWEVDSVEALERRMAAAGFTVNLRFDDHPARRRIYIHDPDGNDWEFIEYRTDDPAQRHAYD